MFKKLLFTAHPLPRKLLHCLCIRLRIPSFSMNLESKTKKWIGKLRRYAAHKPRNKVINHEEETLEAIRQLPTSTPLKLCCKTQSFNA